MTTQEECKYASDAAEALNALWDYGKVLATLYDRCLDWEHPDELFYAKDEYIKAKAELYKTLCKLQQTQLYVGFLESLQNTLKDLGIAKHDAFYNHHSTALYRLKDALEHFEYNSSDFLGVAKSICKARVQDLLKRRDIILNACKKANEVADGIKVTVPQGGNND